MALTYELLLDLYRGRSTAVEQISDASQLESLAVRTPVGRMLEEFDAGANAPRHVVLTGSAGDGKTFAALTARTKSFTVITDASARRAGIDAPPIEDLAEQIAKALSSGRLLLAINRGQLERLYERTAAKGGPVGAFVSEVRDRATLRDSWAARSTSVAVVDLGHLERVSTALAMMQKVAEMEDPTHLAAPTRLAFRLASAAFRQPAVVEWIAGVIRASTAGGASVTMRQLWSFVSYLATGARAPDEARPLELCDAVGARLFDDGAEGALFEVARQSCDPALMPDAKITRDILSGALIAKLRAGTLAPLVEANADSNGRTLVRVAVVHGVGAERFPTQPRDSFAEVAAELMKLPPGPQALGAYPRALLKGIYRGLGLWQSAAVLPGWQTLCYDSSRVSGVAVVADSYLNAGAFKLAVPRPPPEVAKYLDSAWRPPFIWLAAPAHPRLRLTPRAFRALLDGGTASSRTLDPEDFFALDSWLRRIGPAEGGAVTRDGDPPKLRISRRAPGVCVVLEEGLRGKTSVSLE